MPGRLMDYHLKRQGTATPSASDPPPATSPTAPTTPPTPPPSTTPAPSTPPPSSPATSSATVSTPTTTPNSSSNASSTPVSTPVSSTSASASASTTPTTTTAQQTTAATTSTTTGDLTITTTTSVGPTTQSNSMNLPSTMYSYTRYTSTGTDGKVYTVTQGVSGRPTGRPSESSGTSPFFQNKGAVAATFVVVGLAGTAIILIAAILLIKRRRKKRFERDVALTAAAARRAPRKPPVVPPEEPTLVATSPTDDDPTLGVKSDASHGSYQQPPMTQADAYGAYPVSTGYSRQYDQGQYHQGYDNYYHGGYGQAQGYPQDGYGPQQGYAQDGYAHHGYAQNGYGHGYGPGHPNANVGYDPYAPVTRNPSSSGGHATRAPTDSMEGTSAPSKYTEDDDPAVAPGGYGGPGRLRVANE